jgi:DNA-cytosine methyltransferase
MLPINVLSLFDGISCGRVAIERLGIPIDTYFASEIDKYAIKIALKNYPITVELGDVTQIKIDESWPKIGLLIGGSPCQGFSFAGKQLNFDDPRSKLFFEFVRIKKECNPKYFLLENVRMKKEYQDVISKELGVEPILINSALVSAQNRQRLYWTNIQGITQPEDKYIYLKDIIENGEVDRDKSYCIDANYFKGGSLKNYLEKSRRQLVLRQSEKRLMVKTIKHGFINEKIEEANKYPTLCSQDPSSKHKLCIQSGIADISGNEQIKRTYDINGKSPTLTTMGGGHREPKITTSEISWRKLTPLECERLQNLDDGYTEGISNSQRYKCLGNGWTVDVIKHILSFAKWE